MSKSNPLPKAHKIVKKYMKKNVGQAISSLKNQLDDFNEHIVEEVFDSIRRELDIATQEAYDRGYEDGRNSKGETK